MKKKNWLMTIAFAVLALTIVSTCVIGSTYARFTSQVKATGGIKAAGFYVSGTSGSGNVTLTSDDAVVAPGENKAFTVSFNYFSQVDTIFAPVTDANQSTGVVITGIGALADFAALKTAYTTWLASHTEYTGTTTAPNAITDMFTVTYSGGENLTLAQACAAAVVSATGASTAGVSNAALIRDGATVSKMGVDKTAPLTCSLTATVTWTSINDAWDTFIGNKVYEALQNENSGTPAPIYSGISVAFTVTASQVVA